MKKQILIATVAALGLAITLGVVTSSMAQIGPGPFSVMSTSPPVTPITGGKIRVSAHRRGGPAAGMPAVVSFTVLGADGEILAQSEEMPVPATATRFFDVEEPLGGWPAGPDGQPAPLVALVNSFLSRGGGSYPFTTSAEVFDSDGLVQSLVYSNWDRLRFRP